MQIFFHCDLGLNCLKTPAGDLTEAIRRAKLGCTTKQSLNKRERERERERIYLPSQTMKQIIANNTKYNGRLPEKHKPINSGRL